jgi:hypothetical protein
MILRNKGHSTRSNHEKGASVFKDLVGTVPDMRFLSSVICFMIVSASVDLAKADDGPHYFIAPGIKMCYAFGNTSGFSFGWELSVYRTIDWSGDGSEEGMVGIAIDIDWCKSRMKVHVGLEGSQRLVGFCLGPSMVFRDGERQIGMTGTAYTWFLLMPYYSYTYVSGMPDIHEAGTFLKIPIQLNGRSVFRFNVGG